MALSGQLGSAGVVPDKMERTATVNFEKLKAGWTVPQIYPGRKGWWFFVAPQVTRNADAKEVGYGSRDCKAHA